MSWLAAIIDPASLVRRAQREDRPPPEVGLALLLNGEAQLYQLMADEHGWPEVGEPLSRRADIGTRLLAAVAAHLWAVGDPEAMYLRLLRAQESEISTVASLLLSYFYSDSGKPSKAIRLLERQANLPHEPAEEALLRLQLALRLAEAPDYRAAIVECDQVVRLSSRVKPRAWSEAVRMLAVWNRFAYLWEGGTYTNALELPAKGEASLLLRPAINYAGALTEYLENTFERHLTDPYSRSVRFQARDPVESGLAAAVIHCELLGDWQEVRRARKLLGRYLVLSRLGTPQGVPPAALELLRRGADDKGLQQAANTVRRLGPLGPLQLATRSLIDRGDLGAADAQASLRLLAIGADVLGESEAAHALNQLLGLTDFVQRHWGDAPSALAGLVRVAPDLSQTQVAAFVRSQVADPVNEVLVQGLSQVVGAVRWDAVGPAERSLWLDFTAKALDDSSQAYFVGVEATLALARVESSAIEQLLTERLKTDPGVGTLGLIYDALERPPKEIRKVAWGIVEPALRQVRKEARAGSYQFPSLDIATLATAVLREDSRNAAGWNELVGFLLDEAVAMSAKVRAFEALASPGTRIPSPASKRLKSSLWEATGFEDPLFSRSEDFAAARLKLSARVGAASRDQLLAALLELSGGPNASSRVGAASAIPALQSRVGKVVANTLALALSRDGNHDVRAAAGSAIAQLGESDDPLLRRGLEARILELLQEPGLVVPHGVLRGLHTALLRGQPISRAVATEVQQVGKRHLSRAVREWADEVSKLAKAARSPQSKQPTTK